MDVTNAVSELKMENLYFPVCKIERLSSVSNGNLSVDLSHTIKPLENHKYLLNITLKAEKEDLKAEIQASANFTYNFTDNNEEKEKRIININTIAMVLPYLRSQLTLISSQPNMAPIVLPPMNVTKFQC